MGRFFFLSVFIVAAAVAIMAAPAVATTTSFANPAAIAIPLNGNATPYPSSIPVSGLTSPVQKATVTLFGFSHTYPHDVSVLLVDPTGTNTILFANAGTGTDAVNADLTFDQAAAGDLPDPPVTGTYKPTEGSPPFPFDPPAPGGPYPVNLDGFIGTAPNGTWSLFVVDQAGGSSGSISGGWSLTLTTTEPQPQPSNAFSFSLKGKTLIVGVSAPGTVSVSDAAAPLGATTAKNKRKVFLKPSSASGTPPTISAPLRLTKLGKQTLRRTGKVRVSARITFTPQGGVANTQTAKLKIKGTKN